jgi:molybdopterin-guanine dinucleotide biosynthesis protein A
MTATAHQQPLTGILLAGGQSRRMGGGDKCLLDLAGAPMLQRVIERLAPQVAALAINANGDPSRFKQFPLPVIADTVTGYAGPLAGVLAGCRWSSRAIPEARAIVTVSTDAPFVPLDLVQKLLEAVDGDPSSAIALASSGGNLHPVVGLWPVVLADDLESQLRAGVRKVLQWTARHRTVTVEFPFLRFHGRQIDPFFNANTPEELEEARALIGSRCTP